MSCFRTCLTRWSRSSLMYKVGPPGLATPALSDATSLVLATQDATPGPDLTSVRSRASDRERHTRVRNSPSLHLPPILGPFNRACSLKGAGICCGADSLNEFFILLK